MSVDKTRDKKKQGEFKHEDSKNMNCSTLTLVTRRSGEQQLSQLDLNAAALVSSRSLSRVGAAPKTEQGQLCPEEEA